MMMTDRMKQNITDAMKHIRQQQGWRQVLQELPWYPVGKLNKIREDLGKTINTVTITSYLQKPGANTFYINM